MSSDDYDYDEIPPLNNHFYHPNFLGNYRNMDVSVSNPEPPPPKKVENDNKCICVDNGITKVIAHFFRCNTCQGLFQNTSICQYCAEHCHKDHDLVDLGSMPSFCYCYVKNDKCECSKQTACPLPVAYPVSFIILDEGIEYALTLDLSHNQNNGGLDLMVIEYNPNNPYQQWIYNFSGKDEIRNLVHQQLVLDRWEEKVYTHTNHARKNQRWDFLNGRLVVRDGHLCITYSKHGQNAGIKLSMEPFDESKNQILEVRLAPLNKDFEPFEEIKPRESIANDKDFREREKNWN